MTISFSGLASGLDTSSWVDSLVALKKAKVETLEEEKDSVLLSQETLNNIKSFFSSFRSVIEKVTDAKFGVASMDLFAQNLANSTNLDILTASATTEAEEGTYNVLVDKLASETQANSNYSYLTTIVQTTTATNDSKLINLGVKAGNIGVNVNGVERGISITESDTIATFIEKLKNIGVEASYNEDTGVFSMNIDDGDINDIDSTGIVAALHLEGVNEGYTSNSLQTSKTDTVYSAATESTLLQDLGVKSGVITVHANDTDYSITINDTSTLGSFISDLKSNNIDAELDATGVFTISDAEITNEGSTDILNALGLAVDIYGKSQTTGNLSHSTVVTQTTTATSSTLLKDLGEGTAISDGQTVIVKNSNNEYTTITVGTSTTLGELLEEMSNAGLYAALKNDGTVEIAGGTITGGTFDAVSALGLATEPFSAMVTGNPLTETVEVHELVTLQTKLVDDLKVTEGYLEVTDADGNKEYLKIYSGQTIADLMTALANYGLNTSLDEDTGILTITGGAFNTLSDADVQALVADGTIRETEQRYIHGTNLLECLYGSDTISTDHITVGSTYAKSRALTHSVINTINASLTTTLGNLGLNNGTAIFDVRGESRTINVSDTMTIQGLMDALKDQGIASSWDSDNSRIMIENSTLIGGSSNLSDVLDLTTTISGKYVTSNELYSRETITIDATRNTVLKDYGISNSMSESERTVNLYNSDGTKVASTVVGEGTTIGNLLDWINSSTDVTASLKDGFLTVNNGYIENAALETSMGLQTSNKSSYVLGSVMTVTTTAAVTGETTLGDIISTLGTTDEVSGGYNLNFNGNDLAVSASTTINELINMIYANGGTASLDNTGRLSINGGTLSGSVANALGVTSVTHTSSVSASGETLYTEEEVYADLDTKLSDLGINDTSYILYDSLGQAYKTVTISATSTLGDFLEGLKSEGIDGIISNGVISLHSAEGKYISGDLANSLGITTQTTTEIVNTTQSSTVAITYTGTVVADSTSTLGEIGAVTDSGQTIKIYDKDQNQIGEITTLSSSSTVGDLFTSLKDYGIVGTITNGVISLYSESGNYVAGDIADNLGIEVENGINKTFTVAQTITSTLEVTYTEAVKATLDSKLLDFISSTGEVIDICDSSNNVVGNITIGADTTVADFLSALAPYGMSGSINDGVISLVSPNGNYITGEVADALGIETTVTVIVTTTGASMSSTVAVTYTEQVVATTETELSELVGFDDFTPFINPVTKVSESGYANVIYTANDLQELMGTDVSGDIILMNNIDMSGIDWTGIQSFSGTFEGNGYTISNLSGSQGLIIDGSGATIQNLAIKGANIQLAENGSGGILLKGNGSGITNAVTIDNVYIEGEISGGSSTGGIAPELDGCVVRDTIVNANVTGNGDLGNLAALVQNSELSNVYLYGRSRSNASDPYAGIGVATQIDNTTANNIHSYVDVGEGFVGAGRVSGLTGSGFYYDSSINPDGKWDEDGVLEGIAVDNPYPYILMTPLTVFGPNGKLVANIDLGSNPTVGDMFDELSKYGIIGTIRDGVIELTSTNGNYAAGSVIDHLGIGLNQVTTTVTSGATTTSTVRVTYSSTVVATGTTTMDDLGISTNGLMAPVERVSDRTDYIYVSSADELHQVLSNNGYAILTRDIDLSGYDWTPIGDERNPFTGILDGNGYTIKNANLDDNAASDSWGFGFINITDGAIIANLNIEGFSFYSSTDYANSGLLIGCADNTTLKNITFGKHNYVYHELVRGNNGYYGGIIGCMTGGSATNILSEVSVFDGDSSGANKGVNYGAFAGGLFDTTINNIIIAPGDQELYGDGYVSALANTANASTISNVYFSADIYNSGGEAYFVHENTDSTYTNCYYDTSFNLDFTTLPSGVTGKNLTGYSDAFTIVSKTGAQVATLAITATTTLNDIFAELAKYGINGSINDGIITLNSTNGNYVTGIIPQQLGIDTVKNGTFTTTVGKTATSTIAVTYTATSLATETSTIGQVINPVINGAITASGVTGDVIAISNINDLRNLAFLVNNGNDMNGKTFIVTGSISLTSISDWTAIGTADNPFAGTFDGGNLIISYMKQTVSDGEYGGLFGYTSGATLKNINMSYFSITESSTSSGAGAIGALVGHAVNTTVSGVFGNSNRIVGASGEVGGLAGIFEQSTMEWCSNASGSVRNTNGMGGLVGQMKNGGTIYASYNSSTVSGSGTTAGGLVGTIDYWTNSSSTTSIIDSYNSGSIASTGSLSNAGGIVSAVQHNTSIYCITNVENCYNRGSVSATSHAGSIIGGFYNVNSPSQENTVNISNTFATTSANIVGFNSGNILNTTNCDKGLSQSSLNARATEAWDSSVWDNLDSSAYPSLRKNTDYTLDVMNPDGTRRTTATFQVGNNLRYLKTLLNSCGITVTIEDGVLSFDSKDGYYIEGSLADALGVGTTSETVGLTTTSTAAVTYTTTALATASDTLLSTKYAINGTITASGVTGNIIGIGTAAELKYLADLVNAGNHMLGKKFVLTSDIDLSGYADWESIGNSDSIRFRGTFDGAGHTIRNLNQTIDIDDGENVGGLFGSLDSATLKNVKLDNVNITLNNPSSFNNIWIGSLAGYCLRSTISGVEVTNADIICNDIMVGGIVGKLSYYNTVTNCSTSGTITNNLCGGGIAGVTHGAGNILISQCYSSMNINGNYNGGGIVGGGALRTYDNGMTVTIQDCMYDGVLTSTHTDACLAGIYGAYQIDNGSNITININRCYAAGDISAAGGAIAGFLNGRGGTETGTNNSCNIDHSIYNFADESLPTYTNTLSNVSIVANSLSRDYTMMSSYGFSRDIWNWSSDREPVLMVSNDYEIWSNPADTGVAPQQYSFTGANTIQDVLTGLSERDSGVSFSNGKLNSSENWVGGLSSLTSSTNSIKSGIADENTILKDVGISTTSNTIVINKTSKLFTITISNTQTIGSLLNELSAYDIDAKIDNGTVVIRPTEDAFVDSMSSGLYNRLRISQNSWDTVRTANTDALVTTDYIASVKSGTTFGELGLNSTSVIHIMQNEVIHNITVTSSDTVGDVFTKLAACGIRASINTSGRIVLKGSEDSYIYAMSSTLADIFRMMNSSTTFSSTTVYDKYQNTASDWQGTAGNGTLTTSTTFRDLGVTASDNVIRVVANGQEYGITLSPDSTVGDLISALAGYGIAGSVYDGNLTLVGNENAYILSMDSLADALKLRIGEGYTYESEISKTFVNTDSDRFAEGNTVTMTTTTTFGQLGLGNDEELVIQVSAPVPDIIITADMSIDDMLTALAGAGIAGQVNQGVLTLTGQDGAYIESMDQRLLDMLNLAFNGFEVINNTVKSNTTSDGLEKDQVFTMNTSSTLGNLGLSDSAYITVVTNGTEHVVTLSPDKTVDDMISTLAGYGISGSVSEGKLTFAANNGCYIKDMSDSLKTILKLEAGNGNSWTTEEGLTWVNTDSDDLSVEKDDLKLTGDTVLSSVNGFNNGNGSLIVHQTDGTFVTISVDASKTLDEFFEQISQYGLVGSIDSAGKVTITGVGNVYLQAATDGSNILTALKLSNVVQNVRTVTVNRTSDTLTHTVTVAASGTTTLENLGDTSGNSIQFDDSGNASIILETYSDAGNLHVTLNFSKTQSIYDVIDKLAEYGLNASLDAQGRFSISGPTLTDFDISGTLGTFLMGAYDKEYGTDTTYNVTTNLVQKTIVNMTDASKLSSFGITGGNILITQQGVNYTVNIDTTLLTTIGDFRNLLHQYGFTSSIDDMGRLSISGVGSSSLSTLPGGSNILDVLGLTDWTLGEISQSSEHLTDTEVKVNRISMSDKISELLDASGTNLGITSGQIYVYQDGTRSTLNIDTNDTIETLAAKLSQYGITVGISQEGKLYFDGNNDSYLTTDGIASSSASNILSKIGIAGNWSTRYDSTSGNLNYTEEADKVMTGSTKLSDLQDDSGNNLGITEGTYYVYSNGVRNTESITSDTTVNDFMATLAKYGLIADIAEDGSISVGAYNNTYLATSALAGQNSNVVSTLFAEWDFVNIYTSNGLDIPNDEIRAINRETKLSDINEGTYEDGYITVIKDGVQTNISLSADDTLGTLMDELALYGFESVINDNGQLIIKNSGDSLLQNYTGSEKASNVLDLLGIGLNDWVSTNTYQSSTLDVINTSTMNVSATRATLLSELGVSTGEYYIYNNGVKYTALISSDETIGSLMDTLKSFGLETSLVDGPNGSVLTIVGKGDSYVAKSSSTTNSSNVVEKLFTGGIKESKEYSGLEQTSELVTTFSAATEDTLLSYYDNGLLKAEGDLSVTVNGETSTIKITADETVGSLLEKFKALGLEATLSNGQIMIQSGYDTMTINTDGTTSNLLATVGLVYQADLGGYTASSTVLEATTSDIVEKTLSVANYTNMTTKLSDLNISEGSLSIYVDGQRLYKENVIEGRTIKQSITIDKDETFTSLERKIKEYNNNSDDIVVNIDNNGFITFSSKTGKKVEVGATSDTSNFSAITGISTDESGIARSAREMYCVNGDTKLVQSNIFRRGNVTEGNFYVGLAEINITADTTLNDIINQINTSEQANATAYWDNVDGKFVIKSRKTGSALVNIEAGTSNFTDILGYTTSTWKNGAPDGNTKAESTRMNVSAQEVGDNAKIKINGTTYTSTSNTIGSDITRIKGLTINLKGLTEGSAVTLTVERDKETLANAVSEVVDSYNELMKNVDEAIAIDGQLHDETTLKLIRNQLRNLMTSSDVGTTIFRNLDSIGIGVDKASGNNISTTTESIINLSFDKDKFLKAYESDEDAVKELLIGGVNNTGIFTKVETLLESTLQSVTGYFAATDRSYSKEVDKIERKIVKANKDIERYRARLEAKFSAMDLLIAQMQQQYSSFLTT